LRYQGNWQLQRDQSPTQNYAGSLHVSQSAGDSVQITFSGQGVTILYSAAGCNGLLNVLVDGTLVGQIDQSSAASQPQPQTQWSYPQSFSLGTHSLVLINAGSGTVNIDAIFIPATPTLTPTPTFTPTPTATQTPA
jgi:hypothetical protein